MYNATSDFGKVMPHVDGDQSSPAVLTAMIIAVAIFLRWHDYSQSDESPNQGASYRAGRLIPRH